MARIIHRNYDRTEHDDFVLNVRLDETEEAMPIYDDNGKVVAWKIQTRYE